MTAWTLATLLLDDDPAGSAREAIKVSYFSAAYVWWRAPLGHEERPGC